MTDKEKLAAVRAEVERRINELQPFNTSDNLRAHGAIAGYYQILSFIGSMQEEPKFKAGDYIKPIDSSLGSPRTVCEVCAGWYVTNQGTLDFEYEDNWELVEQKPAWSEEDEQMMNSFLHKVEVCDLLTNREDVWITKKLKSLRPQNRWKPSEEQMKQLGWIAEQNKDNMIGKELMSLYQDLKAL